MPPKVKIPKMLKKTDQRLEVAASAKPVIEEKAKDEDEMFIPSSMFFTYNP